MIHPGQVDLDTFSCAVGHNISLATLKLLIHALLSVLCNLGLSYITKTNIKYVYILEKSQYKGETPPKKAFNFISPSVYKEQN